MNREETSRAARMRAIPPDFASSALRQMVASPSFQSQVASLRQLSTIVSPADIEYIRTQVGRLTNLPKVTLPTSALNRISDIFPDPVRLQLLEQQKLMARTLLGQLQHSLGPLINQDFFRSLEINALPPNLRPVGGKVKPRQVLSFLEDEGIPLYLIPRASLGARFLHAPNHQARRKLLNDCFEQIVDDCEAVVTSASGPNTREEVHFTVEGIAAIHSGHYAAAQALFTLTLDTLVARLLTSLFGFARKQRGAITHRRKDASGPPAMFDAMELRDSYVWLPVWNAHGEYWEHKGDGIPRDYSRHASVHAVRRTQYTKRNCVQSLMLVTSLIGYAETSTRENE